MAWKLQLILLTFSILFLFIIIKFIKKSKLTTDIAIIWILWGIGLIIISAFPILMQYIACLLYTSEREVEPEWNVSDSV